MPMERDSMIGSIKEGFMMLPPAVRAFIGLCVGVYLVQVVGSLVPAGDGRSLNDLLVRWLSFNPLLGELAAKPWSPLTYMFLHGAPFHLLFNMLWLWWMGRPVEQAIGSKTFTVLFLGAGLGGALLDIAISLVTGGGNVVGASGAVYGVMVGFAMVFPRMPVMMFLLPPLEARFVVAGIILLDVLLLGSGDHVARIVHLGGAGSGYLLMKAHQSGVDLAAPVRWVERLWQEPASKGSGTSSLRRKGRWQGSGTIVTDADIIEEQESGELDVILEKIAKSGYEGLTKAEKERLFELSKRT